MPDLEALADELRAAIEELAAAAGEDSRAESPADRRSVHVAE